VHRYVTERGKLLVKCLPRRPAQMLVVLQVSVHNVCGERLDSIVNFVAVEVAPCVPHEVVRPVGEHVTAVGVLVVLDERQALLQHLGVQERVQGVARDAESVDAGAELTRVLLLRQVF
jgi:hypothetical protein